MASDVRAGAYSSGRGRDSVIGMAGGVALNAVAIFVASRALGPTDRGVMVAMTLVATAGNIVLGLGLPASNVFVVGRGLVKPSHAAGNALLWAAVVPPVAALVLWWSGLLVLLAQVLKIPPAGVTLALATAGPLLAYQSVNGVVQGLADFRGYRNARLAQGIVVFLVMVAMWLAGLDSPQAFYMGWLASFAAGAVWLSVLIWRKYRLSLQAAALSTCIRRGVGAIWTQAWDFVNFRGDQFLVSALAGSTVLGVYATGVAVTELLFHVPNALSMVVFAESAQVQGDERAGVVAEDSGALLPALLVAGLLAIAATRFVVVPLVGPGFAGVTVVVALLVVPVSALSSVRLVGAHEMGSGRLHVPGVAAGLSLVVTLAVDLWSVPRYGAIGAALGCGVGYLVAAAVLFGWSAWRHGMVVPRSYARGVRRSGRVVRALWSKAVKE